MARPALHSAFLILALMAAAVITVLPSPHATAQEAATAANDDAADNNAGDSSAREASEEIRVLPPAGIPAPGPKTDQPYEPQPILQGGVVVPLYPAGSDKLDQARVTEPEKYNMSSAVHGRINSIVSIHNPSIELHFASPDMNTGTLVILAAGGGHRTLNVGGEGADFVPFLFNYGVNTAILRNRLRSDGYTAEVDAVNDALQAIRVIRKLAPKWNIDPHRIGIIGFSAGAELSAPAAVTWQEFDAANNGPGPLAGVTSRPDFVGLIYPGPTPFARGQLPEIPKSAPPAFIASPGAGDAMHALWADEYFTAMLKAGIPNVEMHIYGRGFHPGDRGATGGMTHRDGIPFGAWHERFIEWFDDLGFLSKRGEPTKAATDSEEFVRLKPRVLNDRDRDPGSRRNRRGR